jgi:hypothetical protein
MNTDTKCETNTDTKCETNTDTKCETNTEYVESISLLMRQTNYTKEECIEKLKHMSIEDIIKEYLGIIQKEVVMGTTNQNIFKAIRDFF